MNQLLHVCLRKSRSEGHALTLLMKELDDCCRMATPTKSLVLAMDGPPSASKLATQRQRRLNTIVSNERKLLQIDQLSSSGKRVFSQAKQNRKRRRYETETQTLRITPGTEFMQLTERAVLYWAWQRFQNNNPHHYLSRVKVYISPSTVAGEGEVKLLEWVLRQQVVSKKDSIAILGGDSDLVLEGLVIPPSFSHNVFVLLPDGNRKYLSVSLWETTRALYRLLPKDLPSDQVLRVRTDLVLLLILNGNDYFPKLRGSSGFHKVFHTYLRTLRDWLAQNDPEHPPYLVEPESLTYNLPFCIAFFRHLEKMAPPNLVWRTKTAANDRAIRAATPLARFNSLVDAGFFPKPIRWKSVEVEDEDGNIVEGEEDDDDDEEEGEEDGQEDDEDALLDMDSDDEDLDDEDDDEDEQDGDDESEEDGVAERQTLVKLRIGRPRTEDYACYELWQPKRKTLKRAKHELASMALEDLFGDIGDYFDNEREETVNSYPWDIKHPVDGDPSIYLGGLLWNLQTYQDGTCADYSFNYGKRMAPTASEIVTFLEEAQGNNTALGLKQLMKNCTTGSSESYPITAGVSCLAALPGQVRDLVPEPYKHLSVEAVEEVYGECMDPNNNVFEYKKFERMCDELVEELGYVKGDNSSPGLSPKQAMDLANFWIVLSKSRTPLAKPIDPPPPFSDRLSQLRPNDRIRVKRVPAVWQRRQRAVWDADDAEEQRSPAKLSSRAKWEQKKLNQAQPDRFLSKFEYLDEVGYKRAYRKDKKKSLGKAKTKPSALEASLNGANGKRERKKKKRKSASVTERSLSQKVKKPPPKKYATTADGQSAIACLKQFQDAEMIGPYEWKSIKPSTSSYASTCPEDYELVSLTVPVGSNPDHNILKEVLFYEQDRDISQVSKQALKQHLATFALSDIVGPDVKWTEFTYKNLRAIIGAKNKVVNK